MIFLLKNPLYFNVEPEHMGRVSNDIMFYSMLLQILFTLIIGYVYDLIGRRYTLFSTIMFASVLSALIPYTAPSILLLIGARFGFMLAGCALGSQPLVNDYVQKNSRGKAVAL